jgi:hypothetical protein
MGDARETKEGQRGIRRDKEGQGGTMEQGGTRRDKEGQKKDKEGQGTRRDKEEQSGTRRDKEAIANHISAPAKKPTALEAANERRRYTTSRPSLSEQALAPRTVTKQ